MFRYSSLTLHLTLGKFIRQKKWYFSYFLSRKNRLWHISCKMSPKEPVSLHEISVYFQGKTRKNILCIICWSFFFFSANQVIWYSEPLLQWQHLFSKMLPLKWICCKDSYMDRMICKKDLVLFFFPHRTYDSNKYPKHMLLEVLMQKFCIISY